MEIRRTYTKNGFNQAVAQAKAEGYVFLGYTWNHACFVGMVIERCY